MVRFEKFKIWHDRGSDADLSDVEMTLHATRRAKWRHAREDVSSDVIPGVQNGGGSQNPPPAGATPPPSVSAPAVIYLQKV